ncbi:MAG: hypothetical protein LBN93_03225, partial [Candidatus Symbiothrix sp.]|nr:hypothetical protein [Candidatus Symbiothrix sp.]
MKKTVFIISYFIWGLALFPSMQLLSQTGSNQVIPYPELAREFQKYLGYPVSMATGIPDINIPLFDVKVDNYTLPFSLSYHSSGIKVTQSPGMVGYGWSLMPSFRITRVIHNRDDERYLINANEIPSEEDIDQIFGNGNSTNLAAVNDMVKYLERLSHSEYNITDPIDTQYDIFTIQLPTCSGNFILQRNNNILEAVKINSNALKITPKIINNNSLVGFDVLDENGILYKFGYYPNENTITEYTEYSNPMFYSSWMLYKIVLPNSGEITFNYKQRLINNSIIFWKKDVIMDNLDMPVGVDAYESLSLLGIGEDIRTFEESIPDRSYNCFPTSITFPTGRVDFEYQSSVSTQIAATYQLNKIVLSNATGNEVKSVVFQREANADKRLGSVSLSNGGGIYRFEYNSQDFSSVQSQDYWGYYNGSPYSAGFVPSMTLQATRFFSGFSQSVQVGYENREPSEYHMKANILEKIIYPTGGYTSFSYEANRYYDHITGMIKTAGGLRITAMNSYDPSSGKMMTKTYKYGQAESGSGITTYVPKKEHFVNEFYAAEFLEQAEYFLRFTIRHRETMPYSYLAHYLSTNMPIWYDTVTEYSEGGKTVYEYTYTPDDIGGSQNVLLPFLVKHYYSYIFSTPELVRRTVYKIENNVAIPVHETLNTYEFIELGDPVKGLFVTEYMKAPQVNFYRRWIDFIDRFDCPFTYHSHTSNEPNHGWYLLFFENTVYDKYWPGVANQIFPNDNYYIYRGIRRLSSTTETEYTVGGNISTISNYMYDDNNHLSSPIATTITNSNGTSFKKAVTHPFNYNYAPYTDMVAHNILSPVIEQSEYKNGSEFLQKQLTGYKNWGNNLFAPEFVKLQTKNQSSPETRITYHTYDSHGNPVYLSKDDVEKVVYLWGYTYQYPIAEIRDATYAEVETAAKSVFSVASMDALSALVIPNETKLKDGSLQKALPHAQVTTFTYK